MRRDFTYIDDIVEGVLRASERVAAPNPQWDGAHPDPGTSTAPYRLYNIGNSEPVELMHVIATLEAALGRKAQLELLPMQPGDVPATYADVEDLTARRRLQAGDADRGGDRALRGVVSGVLRGLRLILECLPRACPEDPSCSPIRCSSVGDACAAASMCFLTAIPKHDAR